jgi:hypothetical protein
MPTQTHRFPAPQPIDLFVKARRGTVEILAGDGPETIVEITSRHDDPVVVVEASEDHRRVSVEVPRGYRRHGGHHHRLDIVVRLPAGSTVDVSTASASVTTRGVLAGAELSTASGAVAVEQATGDVSVQSASGAIRLGTVGGETRLRTASGSMRVATATGPCRASTASGSLDVGWAGHDVDAKSASGSVTVRDAVRGRIAVDATSGNVTIGVRKGTLVWLDLTSVSGRTRSDLTPDSPDEAADTPSGAPLEVRVRTVSGNITVAPSAASAGARGDDRRQPA